MVAGRLKNGVQVYDGDAHALEVGQLLAHALQRAAIEVPDGDAAELVLVVGGGGVPLRNQVTAGAVALGLQRVAHAPPPVLAAEEAVREDLVHNALLVPFRLQLARLVHRNLEGRRVAVGKGTLPR